MKNGQRGVTADTALRLSRYLGTTPEFWLNLQKTFELRIAEAETGESIEKHIRDADLPVVPNIGLWALMFKGFRTANQRKATRQRHVF